MVTRVKCYFSKRHTGRQLGREKNDCRASTVILNWHLSVQWQLSQLLQESVYPSPVHLSLLIPFLHGRSFSPSVVFPHTHPPLPIMPQPIWSRPLHRDHASFGPGCTGPLLVTGAFLVSARLTELLTLVPVIWGSKRLNKKEQWE